MLLFEQIINLLYILQSHVLVSVIGDAFRASKKEESIRGGRDLIVEALRHKVRFMLNFIFISKLVFHFLSVIMHNVVQLLIKNSNQFLQMFNVFKVQGCILTSFQLFLILIFVCFLFF